MADCVVEGEAAGNRKLKKKRSSGRIDGAVTLAMAVAAVPADAIHRDWSLIG